MRRGPSAQDEAEPREEREQGNPMRIQEQGKSQGDSTGKILRPHPRSQEGNGRGETTCLPGKQSTLYEYQHKRLRDQQGRYNALQDIDLQSFFPDVRSFRTHVLAPFELMQMRV